MKSAKYTAKEVGNGGSEDVGKGLVRVETSNQVIEPTESLVIVTISLHILDARRQETLEAKLWLQWQWGPIVFQTHVKVATAVPTAVAEGFLHCQEESLVGEESHCSNREVTGYNSFMNSIKHSGAGPPIIKDMVYQNVWVQVPALLWIVTSCW